MKRLWLGLAAVVLTTAGAAAADLPVKAPPLAPVMVWNWSGFYVGVNVGYGWSAKTDPVTFMNNVGTIASSTAPAARGVFGGAQAGYNWQFNSIVFGIETDIQASGVSKSSSGIIDAGGDNLNAEQNLKYFGTLRGRLGYAAGPALLYVTGGLAYADIKNRFFLTNAAATSSADLGQDRTKTGYALGGGVEWMLAKSWSVKAEYQYLHFGSDAFAAPVVPPNGLTISSTAISNNFHTVRLGLDYHFDWGPVVARY